MSLPGVESARRRRASHGRPAALLPPPPRLSKPRSLSPVGHHLEDRSAAPALHGAHGGANLRIQQTLAARRRLDEKLRSADRGSKSSNCNQLGSPSHGQCLSWPVRSSEWSCGWKWRSRRAHGELERRSKGGGVPGTVWVAAQRLKGGKFLSSCKSGRSLLAAANYVQEECPICLERFAAQHTITSLPCAHLFHTDCLLPWLKTHTHCPFCRASISK